jgi:6,7-dimethyl-8-ribityllumazine synthase
MTSPKTPAGSLPGVQRVAFIQSCWHRDIVDQARRAFDERIRQEPDRQLAVDYFEVPGALELPLQVQILAKSRCYAAVVAAGLIVDGGIYRHEFVASAVLDALVRIQLECEIPILSAVLTPQRLHEHDDHRNFFRQHFVTKGAEVADACIDAIAGLKTLRTRLVQVAEAERASVSS